MIINIIILVVLIVILYLFYTFNYKYTAIIIEPREHKALSYVLKNFCKNLSNNWRIKILHGNKNESFVNNIIKKDLFFYKYKIYTHNLNVDNLTIEDYNKLLKSVDFYKYIPTEIFLIFQTDTIICKKYKHHIDKFLKYDYSGAPWKPENVTGEKVGNGGLSLRRKTKMLEILNKCPYTKYNNTLDNEDYFFSNPCDKVTIYKPTVEEAKDFSSEEQLGKKSFGVHKAYATLGNDDYNKLKLYCPEVIKLSELNK
jgi:hypothetical protein